jgi:hypothetical protein
VAATRDTWDGDGRGYDVRVVVFNDACRGEYSIKLASFIELYVNGTRIVERAYDPSDPCGMLFDVPSILLRHSLSHAHTYV